MPQPADPPACSLFQQGRPVRCDKCDSTNGSIISLLRILFFVQILSPVYSLIITRPVLRNNGTPRVYRVSARESWPGGTI